VVCWRLPVTAVSRGLPSSRCASHAPSAIVWGSSGGEWLGARARVSRTAEITDALVDLLIGLGFEDQHEG
jgi:hypothetical protein